MKEAIRLVAVLTVFCAVSALLLAWTNKVTKAPIEQARKAETMEGLAKVLPPFTNDLIGDSRIVKEDGKDWTFYVARADGKFVGVAFESQTTGYGGAIRLLVGVLADGTVNGVQILAADNETPGLGSKIKEPGFLGQFKNRGGADTRWASVRKDGGEIQAITGATISSRAVARAVKAGLDVYAKHGAELRGAP